MKRNRLFAAVLSALLIFSILTVPAAAVFSDVPSSAWYAGDVEDVQRYGILNGVGGGLFNPNGNMTLAEAITMASRTYAYLHQETIPNEHTSPWYWDYVSYADANGICRTDEFGSAYGDSCNRLTMAHLFARAFPEDTARTLNTVTSLPDVQNSDRNRDVFFLYEQGVLTGSDTYGTFLPYNSITRAEAAAILNRVLDPSRRKSVSPAPLPGPAGAYSHVGDLNEGHEFGPSKGWLELKEDGSAVLYLEDVAYSPVSGTYSVGGSSFTLRLNGRSYTGTIEPNRITVNIPFNDTDDFYTFARKGSAEETSLRAKAQADSAVRQNGMNDTYRQGVRLAEEHFAGPLSAAAAKGTYYGRMMCALYDIDGNGTKELLVTFNNDAVYSLYAVYTVSGGTLKNIAAGTMPPTFDLFDCWYLGGNGTLCHEWQTEDVYTCDFYRLREDSLRFVEGYAETDDGYFYSKSSPAYGRSGYAGFSSVSGWFIDDIEAKYPGEDLDTFFYP